MKRIVAIAHTHWDFEWYFTRQEARVQFAFHMDEVLTALEQNDLAYYLLDGQMSILQDYLDHNTEQVSRVTQLVKNHRLFIGPWYTQVDEFTTSGESMIHNLRAGLKAAQPLGGASPIGYLPDSFGQSQDMPKLYNGFGIQNAVFWRGLPTELEHKFFNWQANDGSKVVVAHLTNGYSTGVQFVNGNAQAVLKAALADPDELSVLPVGSDQRPVDLNLKAEIAAANQQYAGQLEVIESNYPALFKQLDDTQLATLKGEFNAPSTSKIHRGIYSSRYDLKSRYDELERLLANVIQPLAVMAKRQGMAPKQGLLDDLWVQVAMGQAHDSAGGCNSDETNRDLRQRADDALQTARSLRDYYLRKLSVSLAETTPDDGSLIVFNPLPIQVNAIRTYTVATHTQNFAILDANGTSINFDALAQTHVNAAKLKRNPADMADQWYYRTTIRLQVHISATDWTRYLIKPMLGQVTLPLPSQANFIENSAYRLSFQQDKLTLLAKTTGTEYQNFLFIEDGGDEGDTYDYSPAYQDDIKALTFESAKVTPGKLANTLTLSGQWQVPKNLSERATGQTTGQVDYQLTLSLVNNDDILHFDLTLNNQAEDHRMRVILQGLDEVQASYADSQFGVIKRPLTDPHLTDWQSIGYQEEPTSTRPFLHFANIHNQSASFSYLALGSKDFQVLNARQLAITLFRGVGYLGRPDLLRRPGKASGMINNLTPTPDSQLRGKLHFQGGIVVTEHFDPQSLQQRYLSLTQNDLYYQNQSLDQYTTPTQFFRVNPLPTAVTHQKTVALEASHVVYSSFEPTIDGTGFELRLYNPLDKAIETPGKLQFAKALSVGIGDLAGHLEQILASDVTNWAMAAFKPGELRTYYLYPKEP